MSRRLTSIFSISMTLMEIYEPLWKPSWVPSPVYGACGLVEHGIAAALSKLTLDDLHRAVESC
jgi:hypothetical protein